MPEQTELSKTKVQKQPDHPKVKMSKKVDPPKIKAPEKVDPSKTKVPEKAHPLKTKVQENVDKPIPKTNPEPYKPQQNGAKSDTSSRFYNFSDSEDEDEKVNCKGCGKDFDTETDFIKHLKLGTPCWTEHSKINE